MSHDTRQPSDAPALRTGVSRRTFVTTAAGAGAAFMIVPRHVLGRGFQAPSDLLNIATVGINGMGGNNTQSVMSQNIVAICDCDDALLEQRLNVWRNSAYPPTAPAGASTANGSRPGDSAGPRRRKGPCG